MWLGYSGGMGPLPGGGPNQFVELAQESAMPAFQSVESVVQGGLRTI